jgi:hypothetical protein
MSLFFERSSILGRKQDTGWCDRLSNHEARLQLHPDFNQDVPYRWGVPTVLLTALTASLLAVSDFPVLDLTRRCYGHS